MSDGFYMTIEEFLKLGPDQKSDAYPGLSDADKVNAVESLVAQAMADETYHQKCVVCNKPLVFVNDVKARTEGHTYSPAGEQELGISSCCEYCFDKAFGKDGINDTKPLTERSENP